MCSPRPVASTGERISTVLRSWSCRAMMYPRGSSWSQSWSSKFQRCSSPSLPILKRACILQTIGCRTWSKRSTRRFFPCCVPRVILIIWRPINNWAASCAQQYETHGNSSGNRFLTAPKKAERLPKLNACFKSTVSIPYTWLVPNCATRRTPCTLRQPFRPTHRVSRLAFRQYCYDVPSRPLLTQGYASSLSGNNRQCLQIIKHQNYFPLSEDAATENVAPQG